MNAISTFFWLLVGAFLLLSFLTYANRRSWKSIGFGLLALVPLLIDGNLILQALFGSAS